MTAAAEETITVTAPVTEVETVTDLVTEYTTSYSTVYPALPTIYKRDIDFGPLTDLTRFPTSRISSACSCLVATPSPALTFTKTETTTETATTSVTIPADDIAVMTFPVTTVITTTETQTTTLTTVVPTTTPAATVPDVCANRPMNLCCRAVTPWINNRAFFEAVCGYTPPLPSELVGDQCVGREFHSPSPPFFFSFASSPSLFPSLSLCLPRQHCMEGRRWAGR